MELRINREAFQALTSDMPSDTIRKFKGKTWEVLENGDYEIKIDPITFLVLHLAAAEYSEKNGLKDGTEVEASDVILYLKAKHDAHLQSLN